MEINAALEKAKSGYMEALARNGMAPQSEAIPVSEAGGRVTARPVYASVCSPRRDLSVVDGYAIYAQTTQSARDDAPATLGSGQSFRVATGDPLPDGCDAVVRAEETERSRDGAISLRRPCEQWRNVRRAGEDVCAGDMILQSRSQITPSALGAMIAGGVREVSVVKPPLAGIIPVRSGQPHVMAGGESLAMAGGQPHVGSGQLPDVTGGGNRAEGSEAADPPEQNAAIYAAMLREWGAKVELYQSVGENVAEIRAAMERALSECDIVVINAGFSESCENPAGSVFAETAEVLYRGLLMRPGRPSILGLRGRKPILGVPGYPVSGIVAIEQILRPIIDCLCCRAPEPSRFAAAVLSRPISSEPEYHEFVRVRLGYVKDRLIASPLSRGAGVVTSFMKADGIVEAPRGSGGYGGGEAVSVRLLCSERELRGRIVAVGSHDPLIDELSDILRVKHGEFSISSAHAGSMGGLLAVRKGEAHIAGIHLLDEKTGLYNASFVKRHFPDGGVRLVECVMREQGFILQKGNPRGIERVGDLQKNGVRYINRQKGSGTRILFDYLCRAGGIDAARILGYGREEYTHTAVAAQIAAGAADAGLGIKSVARMYGLEFIPVCREQYDLLIPEDAWETPMMRKLVEALKSDEFRERLERIGGYEAATPGAERDLGT